MIAPPAGQGAGVTPLLPGLGILLCSALARGYCGRERELAGHRAGEQIRRELRAELLARIDQIGPAALADRPTGSWLTLLMEQVDKLHDYYARYLPQMKLVRPAAPGHHPIGPLFQLADRPGAPVYSPPAGAIYDSGGQTCSGCQPAQCSGPIPVECPLSRSAPGAGHAASILPKCSGATGCGSNSGRPFAPKPCRYFDSLFCRQLCWSFLLQYPLP